MQVQVRKMRVACASGQLSLVAVTVTTQVAVITIRRAEHELSQTLPPERSTNNSYEPLAGLLGTLDLITKGVKPMQGSGVDITPFDDFIYLPVARTLLKFMNSTGTSNETHVQWPASIVPLALNYISEPQKADEPEHKRLQEEDKILTRMLLDFQIPDTAKKFSDQMPPDMPISSVDLPLEDACISSLRSIWLSGDLSVTAVFAARLMMDIQDTLGSRLPHLYRQLMHAHKYASDSSAFKKVIDRHLTDELFFFLTPARHHWTAPIHFLKKLNPPLFRCLRTPCSTSALLRSCTHTRTRSPR